MNVSRLNWITIAVTVAAVVMAAWFYPQLPDPVPTHWNGSGEVDGWTAKPWGVWLFPAIIASITAVLLVLPVISPRGFRLDSARRAYDIVLFSLVMFLIVVMIISFWTALKPGQEMGDFIPALIGGLFVLLGNYLGKFPKNFFVGIRTPWTLASDYVWNQTHRLAGWTFIAGGLLAIFSTLLGGPAWIFVSTILVAAFTPVIYSFWLYRKEIGFSAKDD
jgi:uncharacterized membrane protein